MRTYVTSNANEVAKQFGDLAGRQLPYARAQAITDTAFVSQRANKLELAREMTLRNPFSAAGLQVVKARKAD